MTQLGKDIQDAMEWSSPSKLIDQPGQGDGWRHCLRRLANECIRLQDANRDLESALVDLFRNPMPHDLIAIRRSVNRDFGGDEELAKENMESWCSRDYVEERIAIHKNAWHNAAEVIRGHESQNPVDR